jgi:hypothetical protein
MKNKTFYYSILAIAGASLLASCSPSKTKTFNPQDKTSMAKTVQAKQDFVISPLVMHSVTEAHLTLINNSNKRDILISVASPVAQKVQLHKFNNQGKMVQVLNGMKLPAKSTDYLDGQQSMKSGGYHVMLINLNQTLHKGQLVPLTLIFKDGTEKLVHAVVK